MSQLEVTLVFNENDEPYYYAVEQDFSIRIPVEHTSACDWKEDSLPCVNDLLHSNAQSENPITIYKFLDLFDGSDSNIIAMVNEDTYHQLEEYL